MARRLDVAVKTTILSLVELGWSYRRIHRELGVDREAISRCVKEAVSIPANAPTGSGITVQTRPPGPGSTVEPYREIVEAKLKAGLDATRIHLDLRCDHGFGGGYDSVKRFVRKLRDAHPQVFARIEVPPGQEAQVDFGTAAPTLDPKTGKYKKAHFFKMTLSCSRHSYEEVVWKKDLESFIRCHENAFRFFGGVPQVIRLDNLKAGVTRACFYDPDINKQYQAFAEHYGFVPLPIRPYTPRHNGKVERGGGYVKKALKGRRFESLAEQNEFLRTWNRTVARLRIHGTTKQQVWKRFVELERDALKALPADPFAFFHIGARKVHPDGHIEVQRAYYSVPHDLVGQSVEVRWDQKLAKVFVHGKLAAVHKRSEDIGRFRTSKSHPPPGRSLSQEAYQARLMARAEQLGPKVLGFAQKALKQRGPLAFRMIQGVVSLCRKHPKEKVEWACAKAVAHGSCRYRTVKNLLEKAENQQAEEIRLTTEHEIIRPLSDYTNLVKERTKQSWTSSSCKE
jgi:transposase